MSIRQLLPAADAKSADGIPAAPVHFLLVLQVRPVAPDGVTAAQELLRAVPGNHLLAVDGVGGEDGGGGQELKVTFSYIANLGQSQGI